jgi:hypothetical protein
MHGEIETWIGGGHECLELGAVLALLRFFCGQRLYYVFHGSADG